MFGWVMGLPEVPEITSLPEVRLSQVMKQSPAFGLPCIDVL